MLFTTEAARELSLTPAKFLTTAAEALSVGGVKATNDQHGLWARLLPRGRLRTAGKDVNPHRTQQLQQETLEMIAQGTSAVASATASLKRTIAPDGEDGWQSWGWQLAAGQEGAARETARLHGQRQARELLDRGMRLEAQLDIHAARQCYEEALQLRPGNAELLGRLSKTWTDSCYLPGFPPEETAGVNRRALELAMQAVDAAPRDAIGHIAACVSMGRLALCSDNRTKVRLAHDARLEARRALDCEPSNDIAHHLMGRWHYEMAGVNCVVRGLVRMMYGTALQPGSHREAAEWFERAVELRPDRLIHHVELGRCMLQLGCLERSRSLLTGSLSMEIEDINAYLTQREAKALLHQVDRRLAAAAAGGADGGDSTRPRDGGPDRSRVGSPPPPPPAALPPGAALGCMP